MTPLKTPLHSSIAHHRRVALLLPSKLFWCLAALFWLSSAAAQERLWTKQAKLSEVIAFEKEINARPACLQQNVSITTDYYPLADKYPLANPLIIRRGAVGDLPLYTGYFFTPADSVLRLVTYDWELDRYGNFFNKQKIWQEESQKFNRYNSEYERIRNLLRQQLGAPTSTDAAARKVLSDEGTAYYTRETDWDTDTLYARLDLVFESTTYRVSLVLYWKQ